MNAELSTLASTNRERRLSSGQVGLAWPANIRLLRAGPPRRFQRGGVRRHAAMSGGEPPVDDEPVQLVAPGPEGEAASTLIKRLVADDPVFTDLDRAADFFGTRAGVPWSFRPALLTRDRVDAYHEAFARVGMDPTVHSFRLAVDYLWSARSPDGMPLAVRMAQEPFPLRDELPAEARQELSLRSRDALRVLRLAARRRDRLIAAVCSELRSGQWQATGFLPGDLLRQPVSIARAWWHDRDMVCKWRADELRPDEGLSAGRPTFLGVTVMPLMPDKSTPEGLPRTDKT